MTRRSFRNYIDRDPGIEVFIGRMAEARGVPLNDHSLYTAFERNVRRWWEGWDDERGGEPIPRLQTKNRRAIVKVLGFDPTRGEPPGTTELSASEQAARLESLQDRLGALEVFARGAAGDSSKGLEGTADLFRRVARRLARIEAQLEIEVAQEDTL